MQTSLVNTLGSCHPTLPRTIYTQKYATSRLRIALSLSLDAPFRTPTLHPDTSVTAEASVSPPTARSNTRQKPFTAVSPRAPTRTRAKHACEFKTPRVSKSAGLTTRFVTASIAQRVAFASPSRRARTSMSAMSSHARSRRRTRETAGACASISGATMCPQSSPRDTNVHRIGVVTTFDDPWIGDARCAMRAHTHEHARRASRWR